MLDLITKLSENILSGRDISYDDAIKLSGLSEQKDIISNCLDDTCVDRLGQ